jgi:tetratricopeptide (TPR) repeat protein
MSFSLSSPMFSHSLAEWGIMVRMENSELDETIPGKSLFSSGDKSSMDELFGIAAEHPEQEGDSGQTQVHSVSGLEETQAISYAETGFEEMALAETLPVNVQGDKPEPAQELGETIAVQTKGGRIQPPPAKKSTQNKRPPLRWVFLLGFVGLIGIAFLSGFGGYVSGITARKHAEATQAGLKAKEQYDLAMQDMAGGNYQRARQRLEYVAQLDPNYPGLTEQMAEVIFRTSITETPTPEPSPTVSPTPDMRGAEERLRQAQQQIFNSEWKAAIETLLLLRKAEPNFQAVVVDDLLYLAYRNSGRDKILKEGDLEGGLYDLSLAEKIGPLDSEAKGLQTWSRLYLTGASFWDVDWGQVVYYFAQVAPAVPNLRDGTGWTASDRYRIGLGKYAAQLLARKEWCAAMENYQLALSYGGSEELQQGYNRAYEKCVGPQITPTEAPPSGETPTDTPTP